MSNIACGLDFGTSNTTLGVNGDLLPLEAGAVTLPSAVFWEVDGAPPRFGRAAIAAYLEGEEGRLLRGLKSTLGSGLIQERTRIGNLAVSFREVLGRFMAHAKTQAEAAYGQPFQSVAQIPEAPLPLGLLVGQVQVQEHKDPGLGVNP